MAHPIPQNQLHIPADYKSKSTLRAEVGCVVFYWLKQESYIYVYIYTHSHYIYITNNYIVQITFLFHLEDGRQD